MDRFAFSNWPNIELLDLSNIKSFEPNVFNNFPKLKTLKLPKIVSASTYPFDSFMRIPSLSAITMPEVVEDGVFFSDCLLDCSNLQEIFCPSTIPYDIRILINRSELDEPANHNAKQYRSNSDEAEFDIADGVRKYKYISIGGQELERNQCVVYVPVGCVEAYRNHPCWKDFPNIKEYDSAALTEVSAPESTLVNVIDSQIIVASGKSFDVYDVMGGKCNPSYLRGGIYIVILEDGYTQKVCIR